MVNELQEVQWAYLIDPCFQIENTAGRPNTGGWINIYIAGTRTKYYAASDFSGTLHPFNIPLDSLGSNIILVSPANKYDIYVLNKYGTLVMSRYNVSPQVAGTSIVSGGVVLDSSDDTITIEQTGDNIYNLSVADIIDSVTANIDESITNIEGDIAGLVSGKKDIQAPYSASGSPTKTVTSVTQDANGVITVTYSDIDLPQQVPNIEIESSTLDVVSSIDPETNTKTFTIDTRSVTGDASFAYGDPTDTSYIDSPRTSPVKLAGSNPVRKAGNDISYNGTDKQFTLKAGVYFVNFNVEASTNSVDDSTQQVYAEIAGNGTVHDRGTVTLDRTVSGQKSEIDLSSIIFAPNDNYVIEVDMGADFNVAIYGRISHWDIFRIDRGGISGGSVPGHEYLAGWGIEINQDDEISVDPTILDQYVTEGELATAIDNVIDVVSGLIPEAQVQADWDETDPLDPSYINNKPDLNNYVTDQELVEAISGVTGSFVQEQSDWAEQDSTKVDFIKNKPVEKQLVAGNNIVITESATGVIISSTGEGGGSYIAGDGIDITNNTISVDNTVALKSDIPVVSNFVTETELQDTAEMITGLIPDVSDLATKAELQDGLELVTGMIPDVSNLVSDDELTAAVSGKSDKFVVLEYQGSYTWDYVKGLVDNNILVYCKYNNTMCVLTDVPSSNSGFFTFTGYKVNEHSASKLTDEVIKLKFGRTFTLIQPMWFMSTTKVAAEVLPGTGLTGSYNSTSDIYRISINPEQIAGAISGLLPEGPMYSAGNGIDITNDTISVDNTVALKTDIPDVSDFVTSEELQDGLELVTGLIPSDYVTNEQLQDSVELVTGLIPTDYATKDELQDNIELATGMIPNYTAGDNISIVNDTISVTGMPDISNCVISLDVRSIELVSALPAEPVSSVLYIIPEA